MSGPTATARTVTRTATARAHRATVTPPRRPSLRLVQAAPRTAAGRWPFVATIAGLLVFGLLGLLLLNTLSAQDAFRLHDLRERSAALDDQEEALSLAVAQAQSPTTLAQRARALGMRPGSDPAFLRLRDGRLVGSITAVPPPPAPKPATSKPATKPSAPAKPGGRPATAPAAQPAAKPDTKRANPALHAAPTKP